MLKIGRVKAGGMVKVGKAEVNREVKPIVYLICVLFSFALFSMFFINLIYQFISTINYVKVKATVVDVGNYYDGGSSSINYYADLDYSYKGKNYTYKSNRNIFIFYPKINSKMNLYINPSNPSQVRNSWLVNLDIFASITMLIIHIFLIKAYILRKKIEIR